MTRVIMLAGAPMARSLRDTDLTLDVFQPAFLSIIEDDALSTSVAPSILSPKIPKWRSLATQEKHLRTGWSQQDWIRGYHDEAYKPGDIHISFITEHTTTSLGEPSEELTQYLDRSFALHDDIKSSQIAPAAQTPFLRKHYKHIFETPCSAFSSNILSAPSVTAFMPSPAVPSFLEGISLPSLTCLSSLPSSTALASLEPQTVTVDLVVGVISVTAPRSVTIRRTGRETQLVEVLVGDETQRGFGVTFWLPERSLPMAKPATKAMTTESLRRSVLSLRRGDVICMKNVALSHFRDVVHGQSLGNTTTLTKLDPTRKLPAASAITGPQTLILERLRKVAEWTKHFVPDAQIQPRAFKRKFSGLQNADTLPNDDTPLRDA